MRLTFAIASAITGLLLCGAAIGCGSGSGDLSKNEKAAFNGGPRPPDAGDHIANAKAEWYRKHPDAMKGQQSSGAAPGGASR